MKKTDMNNNTAYYHSIETFGTVDGPGIRYVLFLSGCDVRCVFCHNPDTWQKGDKVISVDEVMSELNSYRQFYEKSGGGLTVSGGEPLRQAAFVMKLFNAARSAGFSTVLDTSAYSDKKTLDKVLPVTDIVQVSLKAVTNSLHEELTRLNNTTILDNIKYIASKSKVVLRYVVIPGLTDSQSEIVALAKFLENLPKTVKLELLPYHTLGKEKWKKMGLHYKLENICDATEEDINKVRMYLKKRDL